MARNPRLFQAAGAAVRWGARLILLLLLVFAGLVIAYRFVNPVSTPILGRMLLHEKVDQKWVPLSGISEALRAAVITSEDAHFCRHHGVDWGAMREVIDDNGIGGASRGASTITMQVAKNLFLWPGRSYIRKALEIPLALVLDFVWPKRRILEIYLNIAEWGDDGLFGAEAAANFYFHEPRGRARPASGGAARRRPARSASPQSAEAEPACRDPCPHRRGARQGLPDQSRLRQVTTLPQLHEYIRLYGEIGDRARRRRFWG